MKLNPHVFGQATALVAAGGMLLLSILSSLGVYTQATQMMTNMHMWFWMSPLGVLLGALEAAVIGYAGGYVLIWTYNKLEK